MSDVGTLVNNLRYVSFPSNGLGYIISVFFRREADLAVRDFRSAAVSSSRFSKREGGKIGLAKVRYRHVTETLAVSGLTMSMRGNFTDKNI